MATGSSDFVKDLARRPLGQKLGILAGVLAVLGLLYYQFLYSGLADEEASAKSKKARLLRESEKYDDQLDEMKDLSSKLDELRGIINANRQALPTQAELPAFFDHIQKKAGEAGVSIKSWDRKDEVHVEDYMKVPVEISIEGTFYQIVKYFALLGPMSEETNVLAAPQGGGEDGGELEKPHSQRLVSIENLSIGSGEVRNDEVILSARFVASTFRQEGDPNAGAANKPSRPKKATQKDTQMDTKTGAAAKAGDAKKGGGNDAAKKPKGGGGAENE